jgi:hypothetical protein
MQDSVTVAMNATPQQIWDLITDVTQTGRYSPETFEAEWLDGATAPAVGAKFRGHVNRNNKGMKYWTTCKITDSEPGRVFEFAVVFGDQVANTWRYELVARGGSTDVTESFRLEPTGFNKIYWKIFGRARGRTNRNGMRTTLDRIKAVVEAEGAVPT